MRKDKLSVDEGIDMRGQLFMPGGLELHIGVGTHHPRLTAGVGGKGRPDNCTYAGKDLDACMQLIQAFDLPCKVGQKVGFCRVHRGCLGLLVFVRD